MSAGSEARRIRRAAMWVGLGIAAIVVAANAHLVYIAFATQPACVDHVKNTGAPGSFRAAKSSC